MKKKKVLILTYFFPPSNITASQRLYSWARYLGEFGYEVTVITRHWDGNVVSSEDVLRPNGDSIVIRHEAFGDVHYLPYIPNLRDRIFTKPNKNIIDRYFSKFLTLCDIYLIRYTNRFIPHRNLYEYAREFLRKEPHDVLIISGKPYDTFKFGYQLHNELGIKWIADYRDPWTSIDSSVIGTHLPLRVARWWHSHLERLWVGTASAVVTVAEPLLAPICQVSDNQGIVVMNGFVEEEYINSQTATNTQPTQYNIFHNGTVPPLVDESIFLEGFKKAIDRYDCSNFTPMIHFVGVSFAAEVGERIRGRMNGYERFMSVTPRIPRAELMARQDEANLLLMIGHDAKGFLSSKIFEYIGTGKPVLLTPVGSCGMQELLDDSRQGIFADTPDEVADILCKLWDEHRRNPQQGQQGKRSEAVERYSRRYQTRILAQLLDKITSQS